jgi:hypothetical protein
VIERERIEAIIKASIGELISATLEDDLWKVNVRIPKNIDARLRALKSAFPAMQLLKRDGTDVWVTIPVSKLGRRSGRAVNHNRLTPTNPLGAVVTPEAREMLLRRIVELYQTLFDEPSEVVRLDDQHYRLTFAGDMTYPYSHPLLALLPSMIPDLTPVAVSTEHFGTHKRTTLYLSTADERPKGPGHGIAVYIDGSHRDGVGAYGVCYYRGGHPTGYLVGAVNGLDSNAAELMAFLQALAHLDDTAHNVTLYTDSTYVLDWTKGEGQRWMERAISRHITVNVQLIKREANPTAHQLAYSFLNRLFA